MNLLTKIRTSVVLIASIFALLYRTTNTTRFCRDKKSRKKCHSFLCGYVMLYLYKLGVYLIFDLLELRVSSIDISFECLIDELKKTFRVLFRMNSGDFSSGAVFQRLSRLCSSLLHSIICEDIDKRHEIDFFLRSPFT